MNWVFRNKFFTSMMLISLAIGICISLQHSILHSQSETFNFQPHYWQLDLYPFGIPQIFFTLTSKLNLCLYVSIEWAGRCLECLPWPSWTVGAEIWNWIWKLSSQITFHPDHDQPWLVYWHPRYTYFNFKSPIHHSIHAYCRDGSSIFIYRNCTLCIVNHSQSHILFELQCSHMIFIAT